MRFLRKLLIFFVILVLAGYGVAEAVAKNYAEDAIEDAVTSQEPLARGVEADVSLPLLLTLATQSQINRVEVALSQVGAGELTVDRITAVMFDVKFNRPQSLRTRKPVIESVQRLEIGLEVSGQELSRLLPEGISVEINEGSATLLGPGVQINGKLEASGADSIRFVPSGDLPPGVEAPSWGIGNLPFGSCFRNLQMQEGVLRMSCTVNDPPARFPTSAA